MVNPLPDWLRCVEPGWRGLEIGALDKPVFTKDLWDVRYLDHASRDELREKYADDEAQRDRLDDIVEVDLVWTGEVPLVDVVEDASFDFVFASHVFEHVPDPIGWLSELASVLREGGLVCLAIPDLRLCFDVNRSPAEMSDLIDAHLRALDAPSYRQIYDFHSKIVAVDAAAMWEGTADYRGQWRTDLDPDAWAFELCLRHRDTGEYVDGHCHAFTPTSFVDLFARLCRLGLLDYRIAYFEPSQPNTIEFHVVLEKLPVGLDPMERLARQITSSPREIEDLVPWPPGAGHAPMGMSERERQLIEVKRRVTGSARTLVRRLRRRRPSR